MGFASATKSAALCAMCSALTSNSLISSHGCTGVAEAVLHSDRPSNHRNAEQLWPLGQQMLTSHASAPTWRSSAVATTPVSLPAPKMAAQSIGFIVCMLPNFTPQNPRGAHRLRHHGPSRDDAEIFLIHLVSPNRLDLLSSVYVRSRNGYAKRRLGNGNSADARGLDISYDRQRMTVILIQALVARGLLKQHWTGCTAIYTDQSDNVLAWFCVCESFVDCYEAVLDIGMTTPMCLGLVQNLGDQRFIPLHTRPHYEPSMRRKEGRYVVLSCPPQQNRAF